MIPILLNKVEYNFPTTWEDITLKQLKGLREYQGSINEARLIAILTGVDYDEVNNFNCDVLHQVMPFMLFLSEPFNEFELKRKESISINGVELKVIQNPSVEILGKKLLMQALTNSAVKNKSSHIDLVAQVVACNYADKLNAEGKWIESDYEKLIPVIEQMKVVDVYPEASFFLTGYILLVI